MHAMVRFVPSLPFLGALVRQRKGKHSRATLVGSICISGTSATVRGARGQTVQQEPALLSVWTATPSLDKSIKFDSILADILVWMLFCHISFETASSLGGESVSYKQHQIQKKKKKNSSRLVIVAL